MDDEGGEWIVYGEEADELSKKEKSSQLEVTPKDFVDWTLLMISGPGQTPVTRAIEAYKKIINRLASCKYTDDDYADKLSFYEKAKRILMEMYPDIDFRGLYNEYDSKRKPGKRFNLCSMCSNMAKYKCIDCNNLYCDDHLK